jgi:hypothetical protein
VNVHYPFHDRRRADEPLGWHVLFSSLTTYHALILIGVFLWGILACSGVGAPIDVTAALPGRVYWVWALLHVLAPPLVWLGQTVRHFAVTGCRSKLGERAGWGYQLAGDAAICLMTATTMFTAYAAGETMWVLFMSGLSASAAMLAVNDYINARKVKIDLGDERS